MNELDAQLDALVDELKRTGLTVAVAESLTSGLLATTLGAAPDASVWFRGGVVAYASGVKFDVLRVTPGPVITEQCAREMAAGVRTLLGADIGIAVTGVGGPGPEESHPAGTVFAAVDAGDGATVREWHFPGNATRVLDATVRAAVHLSVDKIASVRLSSTPEMRRASHIPS